VNNQFKIFNESIRLTTNQENDAKIKYDGVAKTLHNYYYTNAYNGSSKFLFGSYKKKTNIRPFTALQDVDLIFKMPSSEFTKYDNYTSNGQSALLTKIKDILKDTYTTTDTIKGWGKVVLVKFAENTHNIEVLPAWENENGTFTIPNTENGGSWEEFNPRNDLNIFSTSNNLTAGTTSKLTRMIKSWKRNTSSLKIKSFELENYIIDFLSENNDEDLNDSELIRSFFEYLIDNVDENNKSFVQSALNRSNKAIDFESKGRYYKSCEEWRKIFGKKFPKWKDSIRFKSLDEDYSFSEEYIEDLFTQKLDPNYKLKIGCTVTQKGFQQKTPLLELLKKYILIPQKRLEFYIQNNTVPKPYSVYWKVRNFGIEAKNDLRGEITLDDGSETKIENTRYKGEHYVECYIIKDGICVARERVDIPISKEE
jgi:hypothetical protein